MTNYPPRAASALIVVYLRHIDLRISPLLCLRNSAVGTMHFQCVAVVGPSSLQFRLCLGWIAEHDPLRCPQRDMNMRPA